MPRAVSEGVLLPSILDPYKTQDFPESLLVPFMGKWRVLGPAADQFQGFVAAAKSAGVGIVPIPGAASAFRPYAQQVQLFHQRYSPGPGPKSKTFNGQIYRLNPGMAMAAVPGSSMHGYGLAIDFMRDNGKAINLAERQKLRQIAAPFFIADTVTSENWHFACQNADKVVGHQAETEPQPSTEPPLVFGESERLIGEGATGPEVIFIQVVLTKHASQDLTGDALGTFGPKTTAGVKNIQTIFHLSNPNIRTDGIVDQETWNSMGWINHGFVV